MRGLDRMTYPNESKWHTNNGQVVSAHGKRSVDKANNEIGEGNFTAMYFLFNVYVLYKA